MKSKCVICDIDGTMASDKERKEFATFPSGEIDWDKYFDEKKLARDKVNKKLRSRLKEYKKQGFNIIFLTGRMEDLRKVTLSWILKNQIPCDYLMMRDQDSKYDDIKDYKYSRIEEVKERFEVEIAFEDMDEGIEACKKSEIKYEQIKF